MSTVHYNSLMSTRVPEEVEMKLIPLEERDLLGGRSSRTVRLNDQRFNVNAVMYSTYLIRGMALT